MSTWWRVYAALENAEHRLYKIYTKGFILKLVI